MFNSEQTMRSQTRYNLGPPAEGPTLTGENKELWLELCEQAAAVERDPEKWDALDEEINRVLGEKETHLKGNSTTK
jgi:hypothetical protein